MADAHAAPAAARRGLDQDRIPDLIGDLGGCLHILDRAKSAKVPTGIFCGDGDLSKRRLKEGFDLVTPGNDFNTLMAAMQREIAKCLT